MTVHNLSVIREAREKEVIDLAARLLDAATAELSFEKRHNAIVAELQNAQATIETKVRALAAALSRAGVKLVA